MVSQPFKRIRGEASAGAATTIERALPSSPRMSSMNSLTSRPRSPIRPTTTISAVVPRVIIPRRTDLPTPEPANRPIRCPCPMVSIELIAFTPTSKGSLIGLLAIGFSFLACHLVAVVALSGPLPSIGLPRPSTTRPNKCRPYG